jgi:pre-mRNA-processing factor 19
MFIEAGSLANRLVDNAHKQAASPHKGFLGSTTKKKIANRMSNIFYCSISGSACKDAVATRAGAIYERRLLKEYADLHDDKDPGTGEQLDWDSIVTLQSNEPRFSVAPRAAKHTSFPSLLDTMQLEWDSAMLEMFELKKELAQCRQQLALALYEKDSAKRVIARLLNERDQARSALTSSNHDGKENKTSKEKEKDDMIDDDESSTISSELSSSVVKHAEEMASTRASNWRRDLDDGEASADALAKLAVSQSWQLHGSSNGSLCLDVRGDYALSGGSDGVAVVFDWRAGKTLKQLKRHKGAVTAVSFAHNTDGVLVSGSADCSAHVWSIGGSRATLKHALDGVHTDAISALSVHAADRLVATASLDGSWALFDTERGGAAILHAREPSPSVSSSAAAASAIRDIEFHPDGRLVATVADKPSLRLYDPCVAGTKPVFEFVPKSTSGGVARLRALSFSSNGYQLSAIAGDGSVHGFDLRRQRSFFNFERPLSNVADLSALSYSASGHYLGVAGSNSVQLYSVAKRPKPVARLVVDEHQSSPITSLRFTSESKSLLTSSLSSIVLLA